MEFNWWLFVAGLIIGYVLYQMFNAIYWWWIGQHVKCYNCNTWMVNTKQVYHHVQYKWKCLVCENITWRNDKQLLKQRIESLKVKK